MSIKRWRYPEWRAAGLIRVNATEAVLRSFIDLFTSVTGKACCAFLTILRRPIFILQNMFPSDMNCGFGIGTSLPVRNLPLLSIVVLTLDQVPP